MRRAKPIPRCIACLPVLAALSVARPAAADDQKPVEVVVKPSGQSWSIGPHGGAECEPSCSLHIAPDKYVVSIGGAKEELRIDGPTEITYLPGAPLLRSAAGWTALTGFALGGASLFFGVYGYAKGCTESLGCRGGLTLSRTTTEVLVFSAVALLTVSITAAILYAVSGESIRARDLPRRGPAAQRSFDVVLNASGYGGTIDLVKRF